MFFHSSGILAMRVGDVGFSDFFLGRPTPCLLSIYFSEF